MPGTQLCVVVDDEPRIRKLLALILGGNGFAVLEAENGAQALDLIDAHSADVDLLVSDVFMPGMDGITLVSRVRARLPRIPVILISGYTQQPINESVFFLMKPFVPSTLIEAALAMTRPKHATA
jgi:two-component system cell cycle sensor histidine kinase/response regulator CckA